MFVLVEHFLNQGGREYFPLWVRAAREVLAQRKGFLSIDQIEAVESPEKTMLLLRFASLEELRHWASSQEHRELIEKLQPFQVKKQMSALYTIRSAHQSGTL